MVRRKSKKSKKASKNKSLVSQVRPAKVQPSVESAPSRSPSNLEPDNTEAGAETAKAASSRWRRVPARRIAWGTGLGLVVFVYVIMKSFSIHPYAGDEFIYLYQAKLLSQGVLPYSEFAAAHPPVQMVITALLFKIFGFNFTFMRLLPPLWCLVAGLLLAWTVRRELGGWASVVAAAFFLLSHEPLRASSHFTGVNMTTAFLMATVLAYRYRAIRTCAVLAVLAVFTRIYAIPGVAVMTVFALLANPREGVRLVKWGALLGVAAFVLIGVSTGFGDMIHNLYRYHLQKTPMIKPMLAVMTDKTLFHNATTALAFLLSLPVLAGVLVRSYDSLDTKLGILTRLRLAVEASRTGLVILAIAVALCYILLLTGMDRIWMYYYIPPMAFAAVPAGWGIATLLGAAVKITLARARPSSAGFSVVGVVGGAVISILFFVGLLLSPRLEHGLPYWKENMKLSPEKRIHRYEFPSSILPDGLEAVVKSVLWRDERVIGESYNTLTYVLWHESRIFNIVDEVVSTIELETSKEDAIFGDSGTVPLFALLTGRPIAANEVDTNVQRYRSGNAPPKELIQKIDNDKTKMIILRHKFGVAGVPDVKRLVEEKYKRLKSLRTKQGQVFHILKRNADAKESTF